MNLRKLLFREKQSNGKGGEDTGKDPKIPPKEVPSSVSVTERTDAYATASTSTRTALILSNTGSESVHAQINESLQKIPELAVAGEQYFGYPLNGTRWLEPLAKLWNGQQAYIHLADQAQGNTTVQKNYVYGKGRYGYGYYHLMTQYAWKILYQKYKYKYASGQPTNHVQAIDRRTKQILKQRARAKYRNDLHPHKIQTFVTVPESVRDRKQSQDAKLARNLSTSGTLSMSYTDYAGPLFR